MTEGGNKNVAIAVGIAIQHDERKGRAVENQAVPVIDAGFIDAEDASGRLAASDIFDAPGRPERLHGSRILPESRS